MVAPTGVGAQLVDRREHEDKRDIENAASSVHLRPSAPTSDDVYVMYELMDTDLHQIIRSNQPLSDDHCQ